MSVSIGSDRLAIGEIRSVPEGIRRRHMIHPEMTVVHSVREFPFARVEEKKKKKKYFN